MKRTSTILYVIAILPGCGSALLYRQNSVLDADIRRNAEQCAQQIATLEQRYQAEINDLRHYLLEQYHHQPGANADAAVKTEKPGFNQLISNRHRMQAIHSKYEVVLNSALLDEARKQQLAGLLFKWESLSDSANTSKAESGAVSRELQASVDGVEAQIRALLSDPYDWETFQRTRQQTF